MLVLGYDAITRRSDPRGLLVRFDIAADLPVARIELDMVGDNEPAVPVTFPVGIGFDGRYVRAFAFKPTVNGIWPLSVKAWNTRGESGETICSPGVTVTF